MPDDSEHSHEPTVGVATDAAGTVRAFELTEAVPTQRPWSRSEVNRLHGYLRYELVRLLLDTCASRPGDWVTKAEIDQKGKKGPLQLRNELTAFSKLMKKLFDDSRWPIEFAKDESGYRYRMTVRIAEWWCQASAG